MHLFCCSWRTLAGGQLLDQSGQSRLSDGVRAAHALGVSSGSACTPWRRARVWNDVITPWLAPWIELVP